MSLRTLYPEIESFDHGWLQVSPLHRVYYEQCGNPDGLPAVFVHGGPGAGCAPRSRRMFDPNRYRIILFDQRGCGRSTPHAELSENTTWHLVADMERIREHLGIQQWLLFGGSWGSTLALAYAETYPERARALVLRGIFMLRRWELEWFYQKGADAIFPDAWEPYLAAIPHVERGDLISAYYRRLTSDDLQVRTRAAQVWTTWESATSFLLQDHDYIRNSANEQFALQFARIECHYFVHGGFLRSDDQLLTDVTRIRHIPATIVQGRYDVVCPMRSAWDLHRAWPEAQFTVVPHAGHSAFEPGIASALIEATDFYGQ